MLPGSIPPALEAIATHKLFLSALFVAAVVALRWLLVRRIWNRNTVLDERQRRALSNVKNGSAMGIALGLFLIWLPQLETFALSITAFVVALVIATKELILCVSGSILRASSNAYSVGDWIEVGEIRGEVIDRNLVATTLVELDPSKNTYERTGKTVVVPNSMLLTHAVKNMNFMRRYVFHSFTLTTDFDVDVFEARRVILEKAAIYSAGFAEVARRYNGIIERNSGIDIAGPEPRVRITTSSLGKLEFTVIIFCPAREAWELEQKITEDFIRFYLAGREAASHEAPAKAADAS